ncbi:uncharacterized protein METZ01_LOCUS472298, partial [marine metagenome]
VETGWFGVRRWTPAIRGGGPIETSAGRRGPTDHCTMTKNNYFHMKLREHREEIARLKEELEVSAKAALESESATAGMAAEQLEREKAAAQVERQRVVTQLESVEADRDEVLVRLRESEQRELQEKERARARTKSFVVGLVLLAGVVVIFMASSFGGEPEVVVPTSLVIPTSTSVSTSLVIP